MAGTEYFISQLNQESTLGVSGGSDLADALNDAATVVSRDVDVTIAGSASLFNDAFYVEVDSSYNINGTTIETGAGDISYAVDADKLKAFLDDALDRPAGEPSIQNFTVGVAAAGKMGDQTGPMIGPTGALVQDGSSQGTQASPSEPYSDQVPEDYLGNLAYRLVNLPGAGDIINNQDAVLEDVNDKFIQAFVDAVGAVQDRTDTVYAAQATVNVAADGPTSSGSTVGPATVTLFATDDARSLAGEVLGDSLVSQELLARVLEGGATPSTTAAEGRTKMQMLAVGDTLSFTIQLNMPDEQLQLVGDQALGRRKTRVYKINIVMGA